MLAFLCKERKSAPVALRLGTKRTWKLLYEHFENNINQIIEDDLLLEKAFIDSDIIYHL